MSCPPFIMKQQCGAIALMLLVIVAVSTAASFLVWQLNSARLQLERDQVNAVALGQARDAVLGFALSNQEMPGGLPFPDRKEASTPNYDGNGDCVTSGFSNAHLLGKFPFLDEEGCGTAIRAFDIKPVDAGGEVLWYAASRNLVQSASGGTFPKPSASISTPLLMNAADWLTVVDESGTVLSSEVAFILFAPGTVLAGQSRASAAPDAMHYLDNFTVGGVTHRNWDSDLSFIAARPVNDGSNRFNDRLFYVTRTELLDRLAWRIAGEIRQRFDIYHAISGHYPFAAPAPDGECVLNTASGFIPLQDAVADCGGTWLAFPAWWAAHKWQQVTHYTVTSADQYTIRFDSCASTFTITWNAALSRGETQRSGPC